MSKRKKVFRNDYKNEVGTRHCWSKCFLEINRLYDLTIVVQTETIVLLVGNKINFSSTVLIFGSRSMVALPIYIPLGNIACARSTSNKTKQNVNVCSVTGVIMTMAEHCANHSAVR